jgi:hypothetical protein
VLCRIALAIPAVINEYNADFNTEHEKLLLNAKGAKDLIHKIQLKCDVRQI